MKRRPCSRRFIGSRRRHPGRLSAWNTAQNPGRQTHPSDDLQAAPSRRAVRPRIRSRLAITLVTLAILGGLTAALCLPALSHNPRSPGNRFESPPLDHLIWWESFSEVDQTRGILRGLSLQAIAEIRRVYLRSRSLPHDGHDFPNPIANHDPALTAAIHAVQGRLAEFEGTEYARTFQSELLRLLRKAGRDHDWLNLYLELTYRQPDNPLILLESARAADAAKITGREHELHDALDHWNLVPEKFRTEPFGSDSNPLAPWPEPLLP